MSQTTVPMSSVPTGSPHGGGIRGCIRPSGVSITASVEIGCPERQAPSAGVRHVDRVAELAARLPIEGVEVRPRAPGRRTRRERGPRPAASGARTPGDRRSPPWTSIRRRRTPPPDPARAEASPVGSEAGSTSCQRVPHRRAHRAPRRARGPREPVPSRELRGFPLSIGRHPSAVARMIAASCTSGSMRRWSCSTRRLGLSTRARRAGRPVIEVGFWRPVHGRRRVRVEPRPVRSATTATTRRANRAGRYVGPNI